MNSRSGRRVSSNTLWRVSVVTTPEAEDAVAELLGTALRQPTSIYFDLKTGASTVAVYLQPKSMLPRKIRETILEGLKCINRCGLKTGAGRVGMVRMRREDWAESWKRHFKPIEMGDKLLIKPSWSRRRARKNQAVVVLDPGLSFGTGQHPTTAFCLHELVRCGKIGTCRSFLDIGTGSGILAIAAAKLGYSPVHGLDFDPEAVRVARANARANAVHKKLRISRGDVAKLPIRAVRQYDLICANLIAPLLIAARRRIVNRLRRDGTLVLAGILKSGVFPGAKDFCKTWFETCCHSKPETSGVQGSFCFPEIKSSGKFEWQAP